MPARDFKSTLLGGIDAGNVDGTISALARAWYFIAGLQAALQILLIWLYAGFVANLVDPTICAFGGYFLGTRKSRALAVSLFVYALAAGALTVVGRGDGRGGGVELILALVIVVMGWRGVQATSVYHRVNGLRTAWKHVAAISGSRRSRLVPSWWSRRSSCSHFGCRSTRPMTWSNGSVGIAAILLPVLAVMWPLTRRYPFAYPEMLGGRKRSDIPGVFD